MVRVIHTTECATRAALNADKIADDIPAAVGSRNMPYPASKRSSCTKSSDYKWNSIDHRLIRPRASVHLCFLPTTYCMNSAIGPTGRVVPLSANALPSYPAHQI